MQTYCSVSFDIRKSYFWNPKQLPDISFGYLKGLSDMLWCLTLTMNCKVHSKYCGWFTTKHPNKQTNQKTWLKKFIGIGRSKAVKILWTDPTDYRERLVKSCILLPRISPVYIVQPKIHKQGTADILSAVFGKTARHVQNSKHLAKDLEKITQEDDDILNSHDVVSLLLTLWLTKFLK